MEKQEKLHTASHTNTDDISSDEHISPAVDALRRHIRKWYPSRFTASTTTQSRDYVVPTTKDIEDVA